MKFGFVIDHRRCIGCHACTVACKSENEVPLGAFRTWVKYIEKGEYPDSRRFFSVLRCNQCESAPCITICPVTALFRLDNGIVDFDGRRCIGCKACMQACPYDALYINPNTNTAEKCNYCAHRIELDLEPACVVVCPVQAIIPGDLDDPSAKISRLLASEPAQVRKPEAATFPKVFYIEADQSALMPTDQTHSTGYLWSEPQMDTIIQSEQALAEAEAHARTTYDIAHDRPWGWKVSAYLWTKSISAGCFLLAAVAFGLGLAPPGHWLFDSAAPQISLAFLVATVALLVLDLKRPERFWRILLWPQWRSWLVIGGYILLVYGAVLTGWLLLGATPWRAFDTPLLVLGALLAVLSAVYSAFLFRQARGRVFWHSPLTGVHLLVQSIIAGSAALIIVLVLDAVISGAPFRGAVFRFLCYELAAAVFAHGVLLAGELLMPEAGAERLRAVQLMTRGALGNLFWGGAVIGGTILPLAAILTGVAEVAAVALITSLAALTGVFIWEHIWVQAGQAVPLS